MRKKILAFLILATMCITIVGCSNDNTASRNSLSQQDAQNEDISDAITAQDGKNQEISIISDIPYENCYDKRIFCDIDGNYLNADYCLTGDTTYSVDDSIHIYAYISSDWYNSLSAAQKNDTELIQIDKDGLVWGKITNSPMSELDDDLYDKIIETALSLDMPEEDIPLIELVTVPIGVPHTDEADKFLNISFFTKYVSDDDFDKYAYFYKPIKWTDTVFTSNLLYEEEVVSIGGLSKDWPEEHELNFNGEFYVIVAYTEEFDSGLSLSELDVWRKRLEDAATAAGLKGVAWETDFGCLEYFVPVSQPEDVKVAEKIIDDMISQYDLHLVGKE